MQQLENSRLKLTQLEQEVQQARQHGAIVSSNGEQSGTGNGVISVPTEALPTFLSVVSYENIDED